MSVCRTVYFKVRVYCRDLFKSDIVVLTQNKNSICAMGIHRWGVMTMSLDIFKVKVKYCIYGMIWGTVGAFFSHSFLFIAFGWNLSEIMDFIIITTGILLACIGINMIKEHIKGIKKYRWQQPEYCVMFVLGIALSIGIYITALCPFIRNELTAVPKEALKVIFLAFPLIIVCSMVVIRSEEIHCAESGTNTDNADATDTTDILALADQEITDFRDDKFFGEQVDRFVEAFNKHPWPCAFGIEGPWGVGKTSFTNLCCKKLKEKQHDNIVIYKFNPLNYENSSDVLKNFYTGLIAKIREEHFEPEVEALLDSYMDKVLAAISEQTIGNIKLKFCLSAKSEDQIMMNLEKKLSHLNYPIIIVIDDLDRLDFLTIKKIFFLMRNIFPFPHLKFIVCYDIASVTRSAEANLPGDKITEQWIVEFISKYINYTYRIYLKTTEIIQFVHAYAEALLNKSYPHSLDLWKKGNEAIRQICESTCFSNYQMFLGTPRRIKVFFYQLLRISNTKLYQNTDSFNGKDMIHLLLIYMYYPSDFRKIYDKETRGQDGIYSYSCSKERVDDHIKRLDREFKNFPYEEKYLFKQLFMDESVLKQPKRFYFRACFNTFLGNFKLNTSGSLNDYLQLITLSEPPKEKPVYSNYISILRKDILPLKDKRLVDEVFSNHFSMAEDLWSVIIFNLDDSPFAEKFTVDLLKSLTLVAVGQLNQYKLSLGNTSFHYKLIKYIKILLNKLAEKNKDDAATFILGENGVLKEILKRTPKKMTMIYICDALYFRGIIDARVDRNHKLPLIEALIRYRRTNRPIPQDINDMAKIELRDISRRIYNFFKETFHGKSLWNEFKNLPLDEIQEYHSEDEKQLGLFSLKFFILNQIGSPTEGLSCYDLEDDEDKNEIQTKFSGYIEIDKDKCGIQKDFSQYLVSDCFDIDKLGEEACFDFIEFMLISILGYEWSMNLNNIQNNSKKFDETILTHIMTPDKLKEYWETYQDTIINSSAFDGKKFYIDKEHIVDARRVRDIVAQSLDDMVQKKTV